MTRLPALVVCAALVACALTACAGPEASEPPPWIDPTPVSPPDAVPGHEAPAGLVLNEVMTANGSTCMTPGFAFADWVEVYNGSGAAVDLARVGVTDEEGSAGWVGAGRLAPGERLHLWATGALGADTLPFSLAKGGDTVLLTYDGAPIDRIATGPLSDDTAWARYPDGGAWAVTARPTPLGPNGNTPGPSTDPSDAFFDPSRIHTIEITLSDAAMASLESDPYTQVAGGLAFEGAWFPSVGVSIKGVWGSLRSIHAKVALKIDMNDYPGADGVSHHLRGLEHVTLNNMVQDPSGIHEAVGYELLRGVGLPAPRTGWARLVLNGEDRGFYLLIEAVDERFLARWYDDPSGRLWEGAYGVDLLEDELEDFQYDAGPDPLDLAGLAAIAEILDGEPTDDAIAALEARVDLDQFLDVLAFEAIALHWDGYSTANNYRLYEDPVTGRVTMIPWGLDQTWVDALFDPWGGEGVLFQFCLANPSCRTRYDDALVRMADATDAMGLPERATELGRLVRPELASDPFREYAMETHAEYVEATLATMREYPAQVRAAAIADRP